MAPVGRPRNPLTPAPTPAVEAVRLLIDRWHEGNVRDACTFTGLPYSTLQQLYAGGSGNPSLGTLEALAECYRVPMEYFTVRDSAERRAQLPDPVIEGSLPPDPESGPAGRTIRIPVGARTMRRVWTQVWRTLSTQPPSRDRPILGGARDPAECQRRLTAFLLGPLLAITEETDLVLMPTDPPMPGRRPTSGDLRAWTERLNRLGRFWEIALPGEWMAPPRRRVEGGEKRGRRGSDR